MFFTVVYLIAWVNPVALAPATTPPTRLLRRMRAACAIAALCCAAAAAAILWTGGQSFWVFDVAVYARTPQNALTLAWIFAIAAIALVWRPSVRVRRDRAAEWHAAVAVAWRVAAAFVVGSAPLLWQAARLVARGEYVTPEYGWRSIPHGIDLLGPLAGHPLHPLFGALGARAYGALGQNYIEVMAWLGVVPLLLLATQRSTAEEGDLRRWRVVAVAFFLWSLGPFLVVGGFDTGLKLPQILLRYVPFAANARMPGRAMVVVYLALAVILAIRASEAGGRFRSPALQWAAIGLIAFEYWAAPVRMTMLDRPPVYEALAAAEPGAVCEVPLGIGDGLSVGVGSQDRRVLFYATEHEHPLVGGYVGRMPADAAVRYKRLPIAGTLLALSDGAALPARPDLDVAASPCRYIVVHRRATSTSLAAYLQLLRSQLIAEDSERALYRIR